MSIKPVALFTLLLFFTACAPPIQVGSAQPPLPTCSPEEAQAALEALSPYSPSHLIDFVTLRDGQFAVGETPFLARGVNYYPSRYPWRRFLTQADLEAVRTELDLLQVTGFNTLRLFLWNEALFICPGSGAIPVADSFARLDAVMHEAATRGFRLIMTLNDLPDLENYPLYGNPSHIQEQTRFLVERYRDEAAILAWDVRNEGDIDYGSNNVLNRTFSREQVLGWLAQAAQQIRALDERHLITAGWLYYAEETAPYVDFVSFHHWEDANRLRERVAALRAATDRPILLEELGYSTFQHTPEEQARLINEVTQTAEAEGLLGWLVWTAFDFPLDATCILPACPSADNAQHHYGLWYADYRPKVVICLLRGAC